MKRILEIIADIRNRYPQDDFFANFEDSCKNCLDKEKCYRTYNGALKVLDAESWQILKDKVLNQFLNHRKGQTKQGFFNQLNEAFAYRYLVSKGFKDIRFIKEAEDKRSPDIKFSVNNTWCCCEVKTLGISDDEINRRDTMAAYDNSVYVSLTDGFLNKFHDAVNTARKQISAFGSDGLVYIIIEFDDGALDYYQNYRKQLISFLARQGFEDLFIQIGLLGSKSICITHRFI